MSALFVVAVTAEQLQALKWAAAHSEQMHEMSIHESEKNIAFFTARGDKEHADVARENLNNARARLADIRAASPSLYKATQFPTARSPISSEPAKVASRAVDPLSSEPGAQLSPAESGGGALESP